LSKRAAPAELWGVQVGIIEYLFFYGKALVELTYGFGKLKLHPCNLLPRVKVEGRS